jgi:hypothetical protein
MNKIEVGKKYRVTHKGIANGDVIKITKIVGFGAYYETAAVVDASYRGMFKLTSDFAKSLIPYDEDENTKFKVGDRVKAIRSVDGSTYIKGKIGTVKHFKKAAIETWYGVEFDEYIHGHDLHGKCEYGRGWECNESSLVPVCNNNKIVITTDGKTTTAKMYDGKKLVKSAKADCHPDDEFDFNIGATIALERLTGQLESNLEVEEHFYNGKVVCVKNENLESYFTVGKIYDVVDGLLKTDVKDRQLDNIRSIDYLNSINRLKFLEIVE